MIPPLPEATILVLAPFALLFSERVWLHAHLRSSMTANGRHLAHTQFSLEVVTEKLTNIYAAVCASSEKKARA